MRRLVRLENLQEMKPFDCGDDDLNGFLLDDARFYYKELIANTFVMEDETEIVAYFSLLMIRFLKLQYRRTSGENSEKQCLIVSI